MISPGVHKGVSSVKAAGVLPEGLLGRDRGAE